MKASEVVAVLQSKIPKLTKSFSDSIAITSLTNPSANIALAETASDHGLSVSSIAIVASAENNISVSSITRSGIVATIVTDTDHDTTNSLGTIELEANESEFTGTFNIINVDNRRTIKVSVNDSGPTSGTGSMLLINGESVFRGYNGLQTITNVPSTTSFEYELPVGTSGLLQAGGSPTLEKGIRISASGTFERLETAYTQQEPTENWMFVVLGDVQASKSRRVQSDAVDDLSKGQQGDGFRQQIIQPVTIYTFLPTSEKFTSRMARDESEDIFKNICASILFYEFDSGLSVGKQGSLMFINHGIQGYTTAFYVHQYTFEQVVDLTFDDTVGHNDDVAFRDVSLIMKQLETGTEEFTAEIDLDDIPI